MAWFNHQLVTVFFLPVTHFMLENSEVDIFPHAKLAPQMLKRSIQNGVFPARFCRVLKGGGVQGEGVTGEP